MLLRVGRRRTVWEVGEVDKIIAVEFRDELQASVYEVTQAQIVQTVAEHGATNKAGMRGFDNIDLDTSRPFETNPGDSEFEFTRAAHRELHFADTDELRRYLSDHILPDIANRKYAVSREAIKCYRDERVKAKDPEWIAFTTANPKWPP